MLDKFRGSFPTRTTGAFLQAGHTLVTDTDAGLEITADSTGVSEDARDTTAKGEKKEKGYQPVERRLGSFRRHVPQGFVPKFRVVDTKFANDVRKLTIKRPEDAPRGVQKVRVGKF